MFVKDLTKVLNGVFWGVSPWGIKKAKIQYFFLMDTKIQKTLQTRKHVRASISSAAMNPARNNALIA